MRDRYFCGRKVIGFDIRLHPSRHLKEYPLDRSSNDYPPPWQSCYGSSQVLCPLVLCSDVWPSAIFSEVPTWNDQEKKNVFVNAFNLHPELTQEIMSHYYAGPPSDMCVAFDVSEKDYDSSQTFGPWKNRESQELFEKQWVLMGFDVVQLSTQMSGLFSFEFNREEKRILDEAVGSSINLFGQFVQVEVAEHCAQLLGELIPEHSPFAVCGIWFFAK